MTRRWWWLLVPALLIAPAAGFYATRATETKGAAGPRDSARETTGFDRTGWPPVIRLGILPEESPSRMAARYQPFLDYLETFLGHPVELVFGPDFSAMIDALEHREIEVTKLGPFAYIQAAERIGAELFVQGVRDASAPTYRSYIITREDSGVQTLDDLRGRSFLWVDPDSTSGYLFPRALLIGELESSERELDGIFSRVGFSGGHDASVRYVIDRLVDAAAVSDSQVQRMRQGGYPGIDSIVAIAETRPIPRSPEVYRRDLPDTLKNALRTAYLQYDDPVFLEAHNYHDGYIPIDDEAYDVVRETVGRLGSSPVE